jgi:hypothetical protein
MLIIDENGNPITWDQLTDLFGPIVLHPANPLQAGYRITKIEIKDPGAAAIIVTVLDEAGQPEPSLLVAWYWPDADYDPSCGPANGQPPGMLPNTVDLPVGLTNAEGVIGHPMGDGAWYIPNNPDPEEPKTGARATWIYGASTNSDLLLGLGMVAKTAHRHLDLTYQFTEPQPDPDPWPQIEAELQGIESHIAAIRGLEGAQHATQ